MNTGMLINTFVGSVGTGRAASNPTTVKNATQIAQTSTPQTATTDNIPATTQYKPLNGSSKHFQYTLGKKINPQTTTKSQDKVKLSTSASPFQVISGANQAQPVSAQEPVTADAPLDKATAANMDNFAQQQVGGETSAEPAQSVTVLETLQLSALLAQVSEPTAVEPGQMVSATSGQVAPATPDQTVPVTPDQMTPATSSQIVSVTSAQLVPATSQTENIPVQLTTEQNQIGTEVVTPDISDDPLTTDTNQPQGKTILLVNGGDAQQSARELISEEVTAEDKTTTIDIKPTISSTPIASDSPKTLLLSDELPVSEPKVSDSQSNLVEIDSQNSITVVEKSADSETETSQQGQILSRLPSTEGKDSQSAQSNLSDQASLKDLNPAQVQVSAGQPKDHSGPASDNSSDADTAQFSQIISSDELQPFNTEQTFVSSRAARTTAGVSPSVGEQIQESISSSLSQGDQQIIIRLNPPELGKVFIKFQAQADEITGILEVSRAQTRYEIEQALPEVIRSLADSGIEVKQLEVVMSDTDQSQQQATKDQWLASGQNGWFGQNSSQNSNTQPNNPDTTETDQWLTNIYDDTGLTEPQQMLITDESINMLV